MEDLSLHLLDIVENSITADATRVDISVIEERDEDRLVMVISDDGKGMDETVKSNVLDPFFTTKPNRKAGLGLPLLSQAAEEAGGCLRIESEVGKGTTITASFQLSHMDRKPLGNMGETLRVLRASHPHIKFTFTHEVRG
jgi:signal transduction histidine kinase